MTSLTFSGVSYKETNGNESFLHSIWKKFVRVYLDWWHLFHCFSKWREQSLKNFRKQILVSIFEVLCYQDFSATNKSEDFLILQQKMKMSVGNLLQESDWVIKDQLKSILFAAFEGLELSVFLCKDSNCGKVLRTDLCSKNFLGIPSVPLGPNNITILPKKGKNECFNPKRRKTSFDTDDRLGTAVNFFAD